MIKPRLQAIIHLKEALDNEFILYSYMPKMYPFYTSIKADYVIASHFNIDDFIFIIKSSEQDDNKCDFYAVQFLKKENGIMRVIKGQERC